MKLHIFNSNKKISEIVCIYLVIEKIRKIVILLTLLQSDNFFRVGKLFSENLQNRGYVFKQVNIKNKQNIISSSILSEYKSIKTMKHSLLIIFYETTFMQSYTTMGPTKGYMIKQVN